MKNKLHFNFFLRMTLLIFASCVLSSFIIICFYGVLIIFDVKVGRIAPFLLVFITLCASSILAGILTSYRMKNLTRTFDQIKKCFSNVAQGDFSSRINIKVKDEFINELIENLNTVITELNSVAILKNDFVRNFSHEFKTPIVSIKGFSEILCKDKSLSEEEKERYYNIIREESERLSKLANMTLLLGKLDSQSLVVNKETFFVDEQIEECALSLHPLISQKQIEVEIDLAHTTCFGSKELLKELWLNILSNAIKYTNENGAIKIYSYQDENDLTICIKDNGIGISKEALPHIFDEYYQESNTSANKGIGLGLSICKRIADMHGFKLNVTSQIGVGSIFSVNIPNSHNKNV